MRKTFLWVSGDVATTAGREGKGEGGLEVCPTIERRRSGVSRARKHEEVRSHDREAGTLLVPVERNELAGRRDHAEVGHDEALAVANLPRTTGSHSGVIWTKYNPCRSTLSRTIFAK